MSDPAPPTDIDAAREALSAQLAILNGYEALASFFREEGAERMRFEDPEFLASIEVTIRFTDQDEGRHGVEVAREGIQSTIKANLALLIRTVLDSHKLAVQQLLAPKA